MEKSPNYRMTSFLLVDDESFMLNLIERVLKQHHAQRILRAPNGAAAVDLLQGGGVQVDCIIADLNMHPGNGLQFLQAVRTGACKAIPRDLAFIMLTGHGDSDAVLTAKELDVHGYVLKPISIDRLTLSIEQALTRPIQVKDAAHYRGIGLPTDEEI